MRIKIPITGELIAPESGNLENPVRPINFVGLLPEELRGLGLREFEYDFDKGEVELEVYLVRKSIPINWDEKGVPTGFRDETEKELKDRGVATQEALNALLEGHSFEELYTLVKEPKLVKKFKK